MICLSKYIELKLTKKIRERRAYDALLVRRRLFSGHATVGPALA